MGVFRGPSPTSGIPSVLHVSEAWGAGVQSAILSYARFGGARHTLVGKIDATAPWDTPAGTFERVLLSRTNRAFVLSALREMSSTYDVIHLHSSFAGLFRVLPLRRSHRIIYSPHALASVHHRRAGVRMAARVTERLLARRTDVLAAVGQQELDDLVEMASVTRRAILVPHAVASLPGPERTDRKHRVVAVGRICDQKNPEAVLSLPQALPEVRELDSSYEFVWVGGGEEDRAARLRGSGWQVTGWVDRDVALDLVRNSMLLVHPAKYEGLPLAVLEAMAAGTPVVAHDIPAFGGLDGPRYYSSREDMVRHAASVLSQPAEWERSSQAGIALVRERFSRTAQDAALASVYGDGNCQ